MSQSPWQPVPSTSLLSCSLCGAAVAMTHAQQTHLAWHARQAAMVARLELAERMLALHLAAEEAARRWGRPGD